MIRNKYGLNEVVPLDAVLCVAKDVACSSGETKMLMKLVKEGVQGWTGDELDGGATKTQSTHQHLLSFPWHKTCKQILSPTKKRTTMNFSMQQINIQCTQRSVIHTQPYL